MRELIDSVVIVGGGTAGWMSAAYLARALGPGVRITLLESKAIPRIGVGEATVPNLQRAFFDFVGLAEDEWTRECNASFKTAVKFINWKGGGQADHFYHPFGLLPSCDGIPLSHYWVWKHQLADEARPYDYACFAEPALMDAKLAPRFLNGQRVTKYAWHFDAHLVADFLKRFATTRLGIHHVVDDLERVVLDQRGFIESIVTAGSLTLSADLFIDCSGFRGLLINKALGEPFIDMNHHLLCDSAVAAAIPHDDPQLGIEPYTSAIAMDSGWTWKIPMLGRFGSGYVYSSQFATEHEAVRDFRALWGLDEAMPLNRIRFRVGRNRRAWVNNCVSIGLSSCFLEPLESTGIYFIYGALFQLARHIPDKCFNPIFARAFNQEIEAMFDESRDFIQAHYMCTPRRDTAFWRANHSLTVSDSALDILERYRAGLPINPPITDEGTYYSSFEAEFRNYWTNGSYYSIFAGLGLYPDVMPALRHQPASIARAEALFTAVQCRQAELIQSLPSLYMYLSAVHGNSWDSTRRQSPLRQDAV